MNFQLPALDELKAQIEQQVIKSIRADWTQEKIQARINVILNKHLQDLVSKSLGFDSRWGGWEVDHCNGRGGESTVGKIISDLAIKAVTDGVTKLQNEGKLTLHATCISAMEKEFHSHTTGYLMRNLVQGLANRKLEKMVALLEGDITGADE